MSPMNSRLLAVALSLASALAAGPTRADTADVPAKMQRVVECIAGTSTAAERDAAFQLWFHEALAANPEARRIVELPPAARAALVADVARAVERIAGSACVPQIRELGVGDPAPVIGGLALLLAQVGGQLSTSAAQQRLDALGIEIAGRVDPAVLARVTVPGPPQQRTAQPSSIAPAPDDAGLVPARIASGQDMGAACPYPHVARRLGQTGSVVLLLDVDADGMVVDVGILERSPHALLDYAAATCVAGLRMLPKMVDGKAIPSRQRVRWSWRLED